MRGDIDTYRKLITLADDFTFFSPFGGQPTRRADFTDAKIDAMGRFFKNGSFQQTVVGSYTSGDLAVLALVENQNVEVGGLPPQEWPLRVTLVYRRVGLKWQLAHRHADPLLGGISLQEAAELARRDV
jgi:ketosteroid isomerase-like protein